MQIGYLHDLVLSYPQETNQITRKTPTQSKEKKHVYHRGQDRDPRVNRQESDDGNLSTTKGEETVNHKSSNK